jgi:hypothetical protein
MTFLPHFLNLLSKEGIEATVVFGEPIRRSMTRKEMAAALWNQVAELRPRVPRAFARTPSAFNL